MLADSYKTILALLPSQYDKIPPADFRDPFTEYVPNCTLLITVLSLLFGVDFTSSQYLSENRNGKGVFFYADFCFKIALSKSRR
jgi:hypothetical protein